MRIAELAPGASAAGRFAFKATYHDVHERSKHQTYQLFRDRTPLKAIRAAKAWEWGQCAGFAGDSVSLEADFKGEKLSPMNQLAVISQIFGF